MLSHLANPEAAHFRDNGFRDSLKKTLDAGRELGQPSLQQNSSSLPHSAQPLSRGSDTALRSVRLTARNTLHHHGIIMDLTCKYEGPSIWAPDQHIACCFNPALKGTALICPGPAESFESELPCFALLCHALPFLALLSPVNHSYPALLCPALSFPFCMDSNLMSHMSLSNYHCFAGHCRDVSSSCRTTTAA